MSMGDLITMDDLTNEEILQVLDNARSLLPVAKGDVYLPLLQGKVLGNLFFENSTRTRMSFETAMKRFCLLYTSPSPRDQRGSRMPSSA